MTPEDRQLLANQLIGEEGMRLKLYQDPLGKWTIGVGRNVSDKGITRDEALLLLNHDIDDAIDDAQTFGWFYPLNPVRQRVIVDMLFNLGRSRFQMFRRFIAALSAMNYEQAAKEMLTSRWAKQVGSRAVKLSEMMRTGLDQQTRSRKKSLRKTVGR